MLQGATYAGYIDGVNWSRFEKDFVRILDKDNDGARLTLPAFVPSSAIWPRRARFVVSSPRLHLPGCTPVNADAPARSGSLRAAARASAPVPLPSVAPLSRPPP